MKWTERTPPSLGVGAILVALIALGVWQLMSPSQDDKPLEVHYPYWCSACRAVYDVTELKADPPRTWRMFEGASSDSVVVCIRCDKGPAYPAVPCRKCKTLYLLHVVPDTECPTCNPDAAARAAKAGKDLTPPEIEKYTR